MNINYVQEIKDQLDGPSCHVCGAIMVKCQCDACFNTPDPNWKCLSCGVEVISE